MRRFITGQAMVFISIGCAVATLPAIAAGNDVCRKRGSPNAAVEACSKIIQSRPDAAGEVRARLVRGWAFGRKGMSDEAVEDYSAVLRISPANEEALLGRAEARLVKRDFEGAISDLSAVISRKADHVGALIGLGYAHLATNQPQRAVEVFSKALEHDARNGVALNNRGLAYKKQGKLDLAISDFTTAVQFNPLYGLAYNNRGYAYEAKGDKDRAVRDFRSALAIDPSLAAARDGLVRLGSQGTFAAEAGQRVLAGKRVAEKNCAWCHAIGAKGSSPNAQAPAFRDIHTRHPILALRAPITRAIATPHDRMPKLPLSDGDVDSIIAYINSLSPQ